MKDAVLLGKHTYSIEDQILFAQLSGDYNPMHINTSIARREKFGEIVVHGVFSLTKCLNVFVSHLNKRGIRSIVLDNLSAKFPNPVFLHKEVSSYLINNDPSNTVIGVFDGEMLLTEFTFSYIESNILDEVEIENSVIKEVQIKDEEIEKMNDCKGLYSFTLDKSSLNKLFPDLSSGFSQELLATFFSLTRIVGMECPGRQSIFSSFKLKRQINDDQEPGYIKFQTVRAIPKYHKIDIAVQTNKFVGKLHTFYRPKPIKQEGSEEIKVLVDSTCYSDQVALIVGGSRGLGEMTAKIISAGGGQSIITYYQGESDAKNLCKEITNSGGKCSAQFFDVQLPSKLFTFLNREKIRPTHIYYFATGKIFQPRERLFEIDQFQTFSNLYLKSFFELYSIYRALWPIQHVNIFYPSSVLAGAQTKFIEYSLLKVAGEGLCKHLQENDKNLSIHVERLPGASTDQNLGFNYQELDSPLTIMTAVLEKMRK